MTVGVVFVFLLQGWMVTAFPTSDGLDSDIYIKVPVAGMAEFSVTAPATGAVTVVAHAPCPDVQLPSNVGKLENTNIILGATIADAILAEAGQEIEAIMAETDAFVEREIEMMVPKVHTALTNAVTSDIDTGLDSTLLDTESRISIQLSAFDEFIESELGKTEEMVHSVTQNVQVDTTATDNEISQTVTKTLNEQEALIELAMLILQSYVESQLAKTEALVKSELEKINMFVETEFEKVDDIIETEAATIDVAVETELAKTKAIVNSEVSKMESLVEAKIGNIGKALEEVDDSCPMSSNYPVSPAMEPLPIYYLDSYPDLEKTHYCEAYTPMLPPLNTGFAPPTVGTRNPIINLNQLPYSNQYFRYDVQNPEPVLYHRKQLPMVNVIKGTVRAQGRINLFAEFPCPPLLPTQVGPDGKKYIWMKKSNDKALNSKKEKDRNSEEGRDSSEEENSSSEEKGDRSEERRDTSEERRDSSKERKDSREDVDFGVLGRFPVHGKAVFEGTSPAYGSVSITGHCA